MCIAWPNTVQFKAVFHSTYETVSWFGTCPLTITDCELTESLNIPMKIKVPLLNLSIAQIEVKPLVLINAEVKYIGCHFEKVINVPT